MTLTARCSSRDWGETHTPGIHRVVLSNGSTWTARGRNAKRREEIAITQFAEWTKSQNKKAGVEVDEY